MSNPDFFLHAVGIEMLIILSGVIPLLNNKIYKRSLSTVFAVILGFMVAHFVSHTLPNRMADFLYSSHLSFRSIKT